jgi:flavin-dependent dehydrogenase
VNRAYDVIVVGARCAGSPIAMLLARRRYRVLLVDRATFPSDTLSTLIIHAPGVAALRRWGLLDDLVATGCPPVEQYVFDFGPMVISGTPHRCQGASTGYAPRRTVLDKLLLDAAARAGAEVREGFGVEEIVIEDGVVVGVGGAGADGRHVVERARVVVGADGWNSQVARAVGADRYHVKPVLEHAFYTYWSELPVDGFTTYIRGDRGFAAIPTHDDLTLVLAGCPYRQARDFRADLQANYLATLDLDPGFARKIRSATQEERIVGGGVPNFFRKPYGPGWALVGDAGYTKDPITAQGITDAFHSAERVAGALDDAFTGRSTYDDVLAGYQQQRDEAALPLYQFTTQLATLDPPPPDLQELLAAVAGKQKAMDAFVSVTAGTLSPVDFFDPDSVDQLVATAV